MKKVQNTAINLNNLDISRLSKGIHKYLKSKGCQEVKLGWISEGIAKSLGFNNLHDILKLEEKSTPKNETILMKKATLEQITEKCFNVLNISGYCYDILVFLFSMTKENKNQILSDENYETCLFKICDFINKNSDGNKYKSVSIQKLILGTQLIKNDNKKDALNYLFSNESSKIMKRFKNKQYEKIPSLPLEINFAKLTLKLIEYDRNKDYYNVDVSLLKNIYRVGVELEKNRYIQYNYIINSCFINYDIASLILSEEIGLKIDLTKRANEKIKYDDKDNVMASIFDLISDVETPTLNIKNITKELEYSILTPSNFENYFIEKVENYGQEDWVINSGVLLNIIIKGLLLINENNNKAGILKQDILNNLEIKQFENLFNYFNSQTTKNKNFKKWSHYIQEMKEFICLIHLKNNKDIENYAELFKEPLFLERYNFLTIIIKRIFKDDESSKFFEKNEIKSRVFKIV